MQLCNQEDSDVLIKGEMVIPSSSVRWVSWTQLANDSVSNPSSVLRQLIRLKQYNLARQWAIMDGIPQKFREVSNACHVVKNMRMYDGHNFTIGN